MVDYKSRLPSPPPHPVQVGVRVLRHVVVEHDVDPLDVHASAEQVGGHQDSPLKVLELLVAGEPGEEMGG